MFRNEAIRDLFNQSHHGETGSQPKALATAIVAYARNIEGLAALAPAVERIAQKHVGLSILPEHYPYVAEALLGAIKDVLAMPRPRTSLRPGVRPTGTWLRC